MSQFKRFSLSAQNKPTFFLILSFVVWMAVFSIFFSGEIKLQGDAQAYYEHFEFYVQNISRGVYPMWERTRQEGVSIQLFMRRIGEFNPLYWLLIIPFKCGIPFEAVYLSFLALYFFFGCMGFYVLARQLWKQASLAFNQHPQNLLL